MSLNKGLICIITAIACSSSVMAKEASHPKELIRPEIFMGYEQAKLKDFGTLRGPNISFHLSTDYPVGIMGSLTAMKNDWDVNDIYSRTNKSDKPKPLKSNAEYYSAMIGPTTRLNDVVSVYALAGISHTKVKLVKEGVSESAGSSNQFAWSAGVMANLTDNLSVKAGYEGSKANFNGKSHPVNAFVVNIGYRF